MRPSLPLQEMTTSDKILMMESLWDSLTQDSQELSSPDWHREILEERQRKVDSGDAVFLSLDELKSRRPQ